MSAVDAVGAARSVVQLLAGIARTWTCACEAPSTHFHSPRNLTFSRWPQTRQVSSSSNPGSSPAAVALCVGGPVPLS
jgi:hypothetical protein